MISLFEKYVNNKCAFKGKETIILKIKKPRDLSLGHETIVLRFLQK
jgi:hypothetical protein